MIPKKIHYCWLSGDPFPEQISKCMESWKKHLPDYEWILWDTYRFDLSTSKWAKQAFEHKKYAFAADYIRLHAIYTQGGIYMDTDIEVKKRFDDLLHLPYFIGSEGGGIIEAGVFGSEAGSQWIADCLDFYQNREFLKEDGNFNIQTLPRVMMKQIQKRHLIEEMKSPITKELNYSSESKTLFMFPEDFFCAKNHGTGIVTVTKNTYSVHHFAMSWVSKKRTFLPNLKRRLIKVFGADKINLLIKVLGLRKLK
nr:glycosyltransferase [Allomuricauda sp.]